MKSFLFICALLWATSSFGQYLDTPGMITRGIESEVAKDNNLPSKNTNKAYLETVPIFAAEKLSKTRLNFNSYDINTANINYLDYKNLCNGYLNPFKRTACNNKLNYLMYAHTQVLLLMQSTTSSQINQGVKELIGEKYTHITNTILRELEEMKIESEQNILYNLVYGK